MGDKGWKKFERRCARDMGVERIPVTGERAGADARTPLFAFQFKCRRVIPGWLFTWLAGIVQAAGRDQVGVLVLKRPRMQDRDAVVVVRWADWVDLHGKVMTHGKKENGGEVTVESQRQRAIRQRVERIRARLEEKETRAAAVGGPAGDGASPERPARSSVRGDRGRAE